MKRLILAGAIAAACMLASSSPAAAAARNYDCSKAGNANKAACKGAVAKPAAAATQPAGTQGRSQSCGDDDQVGHPHL